MLGVLVNVIAVIIGGTLGTLFKKGVPEKISSGILSAVGLCVIYIGISGALEGKYILVEVVSMVLGAIVGSLIDIDALLDKFGKFVERKLNNGNRKLKFADGFVSATLLFCIGSMTVVGSLNAGLQHNYETLYTKALLDGTISVMLSSTLGIGVALSCVSVLVIEGSITLLAGLLGSILTESAISEMTCVGSLLIIALGLNMTGISKFKVANYMPAIIFAPLLLMLYNIIPFFN